MSTINLCMYKRIYKLLLILIHILHTREVLVGHEHWNCKCPLLICEFIEECNLLRILVYVYTHTRVVLAGHEHEIYLNQLIASFLLSIHGVNQTIKTHAHTCCQLQFCIQSAVLFVFCYKWRFKDLREIYKEQL